MNSKKLTVSILAVVVLTFFFLGMYSYKQRTQNAQSAKVSQNQNRLVRPHSMILGPKEAPVTIVEFFDPACETCKEFYPIVKVLLNNYPTDVRLVMRYAPFHNGSDSVVKLLEASRAQGKFWTVLDAVFADQATWARHGQPNLEAAYQSASRAGLDLKRALADAQTPEVNAVLQQDIEDLTALSVTKTPTFFVNGRSLPSFGGEQLMALVAEEVAMSKK